MKLNPKSRAKVWDGPFWKESINPRTNGSRNLQEELLNFYLNQTLFLRKVIFFFEIILLFWCFSYNELQHAENHVGCEYFLTALIPLNTLILITMKILNDFVNCRLTDIVQELFPQNVISTRPNWFFYLEQISYLIFPSVLFNSESIKTHIICSDVSDICVPFITNDFMTLFVVFRSMIFAFPKAISLIENNKNFHEKITFAAGIDNPLQAISRYKFINSKLFFSFSAYFLCMIFFSLCIHICERSNPDTDFNSFFTSFYFVYNSVSTVGVNSGLPVTDIGKIITMIAIFLGATFLTIFAYAMLETFNLSTPELRTFYFYDKSVTSEELESAFIDFFFYLKRLSKINGGHKTIFERIIINDYLNKFYGSFRRIRALKWRYKNLKDYIEFTHGQTQKHRLEEYFKYFFKEVEKLYQNELQISRFFRKLKSSMLIQ